MLLVVWWAWNYTTWVTNELDPDSIAVRLLLMGIMLGSLLMAVAIPQAFGAHGLLFAGAYVAIQVGRHLFLTFVSADAGTIERERAGRILTWLDRGWSPLDRRGARGRVGARCVFWVAALAVDYAGPYRHVLGAGTATASRSPPGTWRLRTSPSASSSS